MARVNPDDHLQGQRILVHSDQDSYGDALIKLPFVRRLREARPKAEIIWAAGRGPTAFAGALRPLTQGLITEAREHLGIGQGAFGWLETPLADQRFDVVLDVQQRLAGAMAAKRIPAGRFLSAAWGFAMSDVKPPPGRAAAPTEAHRLFDLLELFLGAEPGYPAKPIPLPPDVRELAERLLKPGPRYVALAPASLSLARRWPFDNFIACANALEEAGWTPVLLIGSGDARWASALSAAAPGAHLPLQNPRIAQFCDRPDLFVALAERCLAGLANHGPHAHLLAAANIPLAQIGLDAQAAAELPLAPLARLLDARAHGGRIDGVAPLHALEALTALLKESGQL